MPDETKKGDKDPASASNLPDGSTSKSADAYTKEQVEKLISDTKAAAGRDIAETKRSLDKIESERARLEKDLEEERKAARERIQEEERAALHAAQNDPDKLTRLQTQRELREREEKIRQLDKDLQRRELQIAEDLKTVEQSRKERLAAELGKEYSVDSSKLISLTDGTPEKMKELAELLQNKTSGKTEDDDFKPDSGRSSGGGGFGDLSVEQLAEMADKDPKRYRELVMKRDNLHV